MTMAANYAAVGSLEGSNNREQTTNTTSMDIESSKINRRASGLRSQSSVDSNDFYGDNNDNEDRSTTTTTSTSMGTLSKTNDSSSAILTQQAVVTLVFVLLAWYVPRYLMEGATPSILDKPPPYQVTKAGDVIRDPLLNQPLHDPPTIPSGFLIYTSIWIPLFLVGLISWWTTSRPATINGNNNLMLLRLHHLHASIFGFLTAIGLSEGSTQLLKLYIQRRRPNFYALCGFDDASRRCLGSTEYIREANFSFPSGHSSLANCGMTFLVWFGLGRLLWLASLNATATAGKNVLTQSRMRKYGYLAFLTCLLPWSWAAFVGASRIVDQWHHPADVGVGLLLGALAATIAYHFWFCFLVPSAVLSWMSGSGGGIVVSDSSNGTMAAGTLPGTPWTLVLHATVPTSPAAATNVGAELQTLLPSIAPSSANKPPSFHE